jgi:hypothetical protein
LLLVGMKNVSERAVRIIRKEDRSAIESPEAPKSGKCYSFGIGTANAIQAQTTTHALLEPQQFHTIRPAHVVTAAHSAKLRLSFCA